MLPAAFLWSGQVIRYLVRKGSINSSSHKTSIPLYFGTLVLSISPAALSIAVQWPRWALDKMNSIQVDEVPAVQADAPNDIANLLAWRDFISYYYSRTGH